MDGWMNGRMYAPAAAQPTVTNELSNMVRANMLQPSHKHALSLRDGFQLLMSNVYQDIRAFCQIDNSILLTLPNEYTLAGWVHQLRSQRPNRPQNTSRTSIYTVSRTHSQSGMRQPGEQSV